MATHLTNQFRKRKHSNKRGRGFEIPAARRIEIERLARAISVADTDDFRRFLVAWQWHNTNSKDAAGALMEAAKRMRGIITAEQAEEVIEEADAVSKCRTADALGRYLGLTDEMRTTLEIHTIGSADISKQQREKRGKKQKRERERKRRRKQGMKPRPAYLAVNAISRRQPWIDEEISRRTWYYRRKSAAQVSGHATSRLRLRKQDIATSDDANCLSVLPVQAPLRTAALQPLQLHRSVSTLVGTSGHGLVQRGGRGEWARSCAIQNYEGSADN
jgi:hypothetical protein